MSATQLTEKNNITLSGNLCFANIVAVRQQVEALLAQCNDTTNIDFSGVKTIDSSALSFWLCCLRLAKKKQLKLTATSVPEDILAFASLTGIDNTFVFNP